MIYLELSLFKTLHVLSGKNIFLVGNRRVMDDAAEIEAAA